MKWRALLLFVSVATASLAQTPKQKEHPLDDDPAVTGGADGLHVCSAHCI